MREFIKNHLFGIIYGVVLIGFTVYALLDVFVIPHAYDAADITAKATSGNEQETLAAMGVTATNDNFENSENNSLPEFSDMSVSDESVSDALVANGEEEAVQSDDSESLSPASSVSASSLSVSDNILSVSNSSILDSSLVDGADFLEIGKYSDVNMDIVVDRYRYCDTYVFVADVNIRSPKLFKTAFANDTYGRNINKKTTEMAAAKGAVLAINGDFYGARQSGYVIRNGELYSNVPNPRNQDLAVFEDGNFAIFNEADVAAEDVLAVSVNHVFAFGPGLVTGGQISVGERQEVSHASYSNPRTAIGMIEPGHYLFVVSDGRTDISKGLSLYQLAIFMQAGGCKEAYNLDGGGSSTMVFMGNLINNPCPGYGYIVERSVSDIVYIGY